MNVQTALLQGSQLLEDAQVAVPRLTAEVLLAHAMRSERAYLFAHPEQELREVEWLHYGRYLHERMTGKPTQYITNRQEFYGREFRVSRDVLIPRPETEHVVELALQRARGARQILDVGTGSGALAVTLQLETGAAALATDISPAAAAVADQNARRLGSRVAVVVCDLMAAVRERSIDLIVSNPPYVPATQRAGLQREVRDWEPAVALFAGSTGFEIYDRIAADAPRVLRPGGWVILELGFGSLEHVRRLFREWGNVTVEPDLAGIPRVLSAQLTASPAASIPA
ncbi:MAG TPA: peptide chain release factor N(5)-glutamine methyltransferase [Bryobacteraceae bacterium]|nr:peptide chain release factor N(5)-glutamine methyltransferase [Bryobacteraceae bacterium]